MAAEDSLGRQWQYAPSLSTAKVAGILKRAGLERYTNKRGGQRTVRSSATGNRLATRYAQTSGLEIEPETQSYRRPGDRPSYDTKYSGRYLIGYRQGYSSNAKRHTPEEVNVTSTIHP